MINLSSILKNKHTTGAGLAYAVLKLSPKVAHIWFPGHEQQIQSTVELLEPVAIAYGLGMAGDAGQGASKDDAAKLAAQIEATQKAVVSGDTSIITKASLPPIDKPVTVPETPNTK